LIGDREGGGFKKIKEKAATLVTVIDAGTTVLLQR
jgi:hypothetical protein